MSFIKCNCGKYADIENSKSYLGFNIMDGSLTEIESCFIRKEDGTDLNEIKREIIEYLNSDRTKQIKYNDNKFLDKLTFKNTSKNKCKMTINNWSVTLDKKIVLKKLEDKVEIIEFKCYKNSKEEITSEFKYDGSLYEMCDGIIELIKNVLNEFADKHTTAPKEQVADIVRRHLICNINNTIDDKYDMDSLFEKTILESEKKDDKNDNQ